MRRFCLGAANDLGLKHRREGRHGALLPGARHVAHRRVDSPACPTRAAGSAPSTARRRCRRTSSSSSPAVTRWSRASCSSSRTACAAARRCSRWRRPSCAGAGLLCVFKDGPDCPRHRVRHQGRAATRSGRRSCSSHSPKAKPAKPEELGLDAARRRRHPRARHACASSRRPRARCSRPPPSSVRARDRAAGRSRTARAV